MNVLGGWVLAVVVLLSGCGDPGSDAPGDLESGRPRHAILIVLDTLRADRVSAYGYPRVTTPRLDALAAEGVRFETVVSSAPWTLPSMGALLSGQAPRKAFDPSYRLATSLVERARDQGLATVAFTEGGYVSRHFRMDLGFDAFHEEHAFTAHFDGETIGGDGPVGSVQRTFAAATEWLDRHGDEPFFMLVHTYEPHIPYTHGEPFGEGLSPGRLGEVVTAEVLPSLRDGVLVPTDDEQAWVEALHDGDIREADRHLGLFLDALEARGLADQTLVAVTSDHGEELGDHFPRHRYDHGHSLLDDLLLVPLVVKDPTREDWAGRLVTEQVRLVDVVPTLLDRLGIPTPGERAGESLVPLITGRERGDRLAFSVQTKVGPPRVSVRDGRRKAILSLGDDPGRPAPLVPPVTKLRVFDLEADPGETRDISGDDPEQAAALRRLLRGWLQERGPDDLAEPVVDDPRLMEQLRALGYVR